MELPQRFMENLQKKLIYSEEKGFSKYHTKDGKRKLAVDLGDSLELLDSVQADYVIENSYQQVYQQVYFGEVLNDSEWKGFVLEGIKSHHLDLYEKYSDKQKLKDKEAHQAHERS